MQRSTGSTDNQETQNIVINADYELFVAAIILLSILNGIFYFLPIDPQAWQLTVIVDLGISLFLLMDFLVKLLRSKPKRYYLIARYGWLDFLGSLPLPLAALLRLLRLMIVYRKMRAADMRLMGRVVVQKRASSTLLFVLLLAIVVLELGGIWVLGAESHSADANIKTASDALWWGYVTVATVGYGDRYPVTNSGRLVGVFMITAGVALFSVLTGFVGDWFRRPHKVEKELPTALNDLAASDAHSSVRLIRQLLDEHENANQRSLAELRRRLQEVERLLAEKEADNTPD